MSAPMLRRIRDVGWADLPEIGGKASSLGELLRAGVNVPDGVVLTASAAALGHEERAALLEDAVGTLGQGPFAVRSSGISEDGRDQSFAGVYESLLGVAAGGLGDAVAEVLRSAGAARADAYASVAGRAMAVIVQRMVPAAAAGVALTADPVNGDRRSSVVTAVRGTADRLVSGEVMGDEWVVREGTTVARRQPEHAIGPRQAALVADAARGIAATRGTPQDVEWAIDAAGELWIVQARPMTALPPEVSWASPAPGGFTRQLRFGEWISEPVTPLFESWLLSTMEERFHGKLLELLGQRAPRPYHVVVNGWYFYSLNWASGGAWLRNMPRLLWHAIRTPRHVAGILPPTVRYGIKLAERQWRDDIRPRYRTAVADAEARVDAMPVAELPGLIDELAGLAGEYFVSVAALAGSAYKLELNLARFYRRHLAPTLGGSHLPLLSGFAPPTAPPPHAVVSLDWWHAPMAATAGLGPTLPHGDHAAIIAARHAVEAASFAALHSSPRRFRAFQRLLADAQHVVPIREEQVSELTLPWPVMRRAVTRIGEVLVGRGLVAGADDVFFLTRAEVQAALAGGSTGSAVDVEARRSTRQEQARLVPPLLIGRVNPLLQRLWEAFPKFLGAVRSDRAIVSGVPASPGRASGAVRIVRGPADFDALQAGEVLVAPMTAPAWTPLFIRAVAVVTDVGSAAAHASIIAREYGIPAVVGCGDATARLRTGMLVVVDGSAGNVEAVVS